MTRKSEAERLAELAVRAEETGTESELLDQMIGLRKDLGAERSKHLRDRLVFVVVVGALLLLNHRTDDALAASQRIRDGARVGSCIALDNIYSKHNKFVETTIDERQSIIDATNAGTQTPEQKAQSVAFFEKQIEDYKTDIVPLVNCDDSKALDALFSKPGG